MALIAFIIMAGATLPSPLYDLWAKQYRFGPAIVTLVFAVQAVCTILTLLLGRVSDHLGRRPVHFTALGLLIASTVIFYLAAGLLMLVVARALSGIAVGLTQGTAPAALLELEPRHDPYRASLLAMLAATGGLGTGPLVAGLVAQYAPAPTRSPFLLYGAALALALTLMVFVPETAPDRDGRLSLRPKVGWPDRGRELFAAAGAVAFASFAMQSIFSALAASLLAGTLHETSHALAGAVVFLVFCMGTAGQLLCRGWGFRALILAGVAGVAGGLAVLIAGFASSNVAEFLAGAVIGGAGAGVATMGALAAVNQLAPPHRRAEILSAYSLMAYAGVCLPVVGFGVLAERFGATAAAAGFAGLLLCSIVFAVIVTAMFGGALPARAGPKA